MSTLTINACGVYINNDIDIISLKLDRGIHL